MVKSSSYRRVPRASVQAVADRAGVSKTTVSHILNRKHPYFEQFSQETIERVLRCAKELNYRPNILASGLKTGRSRLFAVSFEDCWSDADQRAWSGGMESMMLSGVSACASRRHYFPVIGLYGERSTEAEIEILDSLVQAGVGGLLLKAPTDGTSSYLQELTERKYPFVVVFPQSEMAGNNYVEVNNPEAGYLATEHLISMGHRRILAVLENRPRISQEQRYGGYVKAMQNHGLEPLEPVSIGLQPSGLMPASSVELFRTAVHDNRVTGAYATVGGVAVSLVLSSRETGIHVPGNLALIGMDIGWWRVHGYPQLSSIGISWYYVGEIATERLVNQMEKDEPMQEPVLLKPEMQDGETAIAVDAVTSPRT